jgi:hypothetical protein
MRRCWVIALLLAGFATGTDPYISASRKIESIESDRLRPGTRVILTPAELEAWVAQKAPDGVRNPHVELQRGAEAKGAALIDFGRVRRAQGHPPGWLASMLLNGERPVAVTARIRSGEGHAIVDVERVDIGGVTIDGAMLDFLIHNFLLPLYPNAAVGQPFDLGHHIERLDVQPGAVSVVIGK